MAPLVLMHSFLPFPSSSGANEARVASVLMRHFVMPLSKFKGGGGQARKQEGRWIPDHLSLPPSHPSCSSLAIRPSTWL